MTKAATASSEPAEVAASSEPAKLKGRRAGPLDPEQREHACRVRQLGACAKCAKSKLRVMSHLAILNQRSIAYRLQCIHVKWLCHVVILLFPLYLLQIDLICYRKVWRNQ